MRPGADRLNFFEGINAAAAFLDTFAQWIEIERLQSFFWFGLKPLVSDEELPVYEVNVGFDAAKAVFQCIEERTLVFIIVVRVAVNQCNDGMLPTRAANDLARFGVGVFAVLENLHSVDKNVANTG